MTHRRNLWTPEEDAIVREFYPDEGEDGCAARLPHRNKPAIRFRAWFLCLHRLPLELRSANIAAWNATSAPSEPQPRETKRIVRPEELRPGMRANRYPVGTNAEPAFRTVTETRLRAFGDRRSFALSWIPESTTAAGRRELGMELWNLDVHPNLAFEVEVSA